MFTISICCLKPYTRRINHETEQSEVHHSLFNQLRGHACRSDPDTALARVGHLSVRGLHHNWRVGVVHGRVLGECRFTDDRKMKKPGSGNLSDF